MIIDKFLVPFIDFVDRYFGRKEHKYIFITSEKYKFGLTKEHNVEFLYTDYDIFTTVKNYMYQSDKIILHGLLRDKIDKLLLDNPKLFKKCYWIMWGGDFYFPELQSENRKKVIANIKYFVNFTPGDFDYIKQHYGANGKLFRCFSYPSNIFHPIESEQKTNDTVNILVGNSATSTNHHFEIFDILTKYKDENTQVYTPLTYGDFQYGMKVMQQGYETFGSKFKPIIEHMEIQAYKSFLTTIDIAMFHHKRQQATGNTVQLLGMGAKVYMHPTSTLWSLFDELHIKVFDINNFSIDKIDDTTKETNILKVKNIFSEQNLYKCLSKLFYNDEF
jgi:hypothetical protein